MKIFNVVFCCGGLLEPDPVAFSSKGKLKTFFEEKFGRKFETVQDMDDFLEKHNEKAADSSSEMEYRVFEIEVDRQSTKETPEEEQPGDTLRIDKVAYAETTDAILDAALEHSFAMVDTNVVLNCLDAISNLEAEEDLCDDEKQLLGMCKQAVEKAGQQDIDLILYK